MTDFRALCADLLSATDDDISFRTNVSGHASSDALRFSKAVLSARNALAQPEPEWPSDEELLALMPETMRDEFSYAAKVCSDATGGQVKPGIFRVALNTAALEYAQAVLARWGNL